MQKGDKCSYYQADRSKYWLTKEKCAWGEMQTGEKCNWGEMQTGEKCRQERNATGEKSRQGRNADTGGNAATIKTDRSNYWQTGEKCN